MNKMRGNELQGLGWSQTNSGGLLALTTLSRTPLQRKLGVMEVGGPPWWNEEGLKEGGGAEQQFSALWDFSMLPNDISLSYFHLGHQYFPIWQTLSLQPSFQTLVPTLWMPAVASSCHGCRRRYDLNGSGAHTVLTDSRLSRVWGSCTDAPTALNVTFNWIPVIEILPVKTRRTERLLLPGTCALVMNSDVCDMGDWWERTDSKTQVTLLCNLCHTYQIYSHRQPSLEAHVEVAFAALGIILRKCRLL